MKPRKTLSVYVLLVGIMGLSIVGGILAFQIFSAAVKSQLTAAQKEAIKPIDGVIDQKAVDNLQKRVTISEAEIGLLSTLTPTPTLTPTIEASMAGRVATPSGEQTKPTQ